MHMQILLCIVKRTSLECGGVNRGDLYLIAGPSREISVCDLRTTWPSITSSRPKTLKEDRNIMDHMQLCLAIPNTQYSHSEGDRISERSGRRRGQMQAAVLHSVPLLFVASSHLDT